MIKSKFRLGDKVKGNNTKRIGIVIGFTDYQYLVLHGTGGIFSEDSINQFKMSKNFIGKRIIFIDYNCCTEIEKLQDYN